MSCSLSEMLLTMLLMTLLQDVGGGVDVDDDVAVAVHLKMQYMASVNIENKFPLFVIVVVNGFLFFLRQFATKSSWKCSFFFYLLNKICFFFGLFRLQFISKVRFLSLLFEIKFPTKRYQTRGWKLFDDKADGDN